MYQNYLDAILKFYEQQKVDNNLSSRLLNPTPRNIRDECVSAYQSRFSKKDLRILKPFFEVHDGSISLKAIEGVDLDKLKPLSNHLKDATGKTFDRNIELLGWLLNFEPRPYDDNYDYKRGATSTAKKTTEVLPKDPTKAEANGKAENLTEFTNTSIQPEPTNNKQIEQKQSRRTKKMRFIAGGFIIASGLIAAFTFNNKVDKGCMIWVGDHYERVSCDSSGGMGLVLGLDVNRVRHLRRITRPDTLTEEDIGKVWYRKRGGDSLDFYTTGGRDPVDPNLDLKRLTAYIFEKYLRKKSSTDSSSVQ